MASKLKERRVSRRPPCAHGSAGPPSRPSPEPFAALPFEKPPHKKTTTAPSQKQGCPARAVRAVGEPPGPRRDDRPPEHRPSRDRVAPGTASRSGVGDQLPWRGRDRGRGQLSQRDRIHLFSLPPLTRPICFAEDAGFPQSD